MTTKQKRYEKSIFCVDRNPIGFGFSDRNNNAANVHAWAQ